MLDEINRTESTPALTPRNFDLLFRVEALLDRSFITPAIQQDETVALFAARAVAELRGHACLHEDIADRIERLLLRDE